MTPTSKSAQSCSLNAPDFKDRVAWIAALNDRVGSTNPCSACQCAKAASLNVLIAARGACSAR